MKISKKGQKRYETIMQVALELFLENGYEKTSLNDIVKKSGGSLSSIYKFFESKERLFATIIKGKFLEFKEQINDIALNQTDDIEKFLNEFGLAYIEIFFKPDGIKLTRIVMSETYKNKEVIKLFSELDAIKILQDFFEKQEVRSKIKLNDISGLAYKFCALIREPFFIKNIILGEELKQLSLKEKQNLVSQNVEIFLNGITG
ncbi:TetR/AcrR family transcriptional regulator [Campylobacter mucosalis]|uniref:Multidrug efflux system CmeABC transcriptional regulator, TetR family n=1 Tax=Campylobacter mucosalis CCUG 21559 TaxID=1032067 RepID=A0A6G5QEE3_9BACT|nr:TetR/AcrR family transcriptional regulator [Campylobacter mucosalis]KEA45789.1 hypothetical protein CR66_05090 [Campylobacter mucosalis]QCD43959.1 multidrug efflux system CmeABC transcriptional regulator, TetR family [Campylobacter mucosalis CCUG 21559]QKF62309.1 multidrug efflux system CmeABC transcriptional regulator, TetR family [Campylobacter mucosalis]